MVGAVLIGFGHLNHTAACCYECAISSFLVVTRARTGHCDRPLRFDLTVVCLCLEQSFLPHCIWQGQTRKRPVDNAPRSEIRSVLVDAAQQGFTAVVDPKGVANGARKHYDPKSSDAATWRPSRVMVPSPERVDRPAGKRVLAEEPTYPDVPRPEKVHSDRFNARTTTESEFAQGLRIEKKGVVVDPVTGVPRSRVPSKESDVGLTMGRKHRVDPKDLSAIRCVLSRSQGHDAVVAPHAVPSRSGVVSLS